VSKSKTQSQRPGLSSILIRTVLECILSEGITKCYIGIPCPSGTLVPVSPTFVPGGRKSGTTSDGQENNVKSKPSFPIWPETHIWSVTRSSTLRAPFSSTHRVLVESLLISTKSGLWSHYEPKLAGSQLRIFTPFNITTMTPSLASECAKKSYDAWSESIPTFYPSTSTFCYKLGTVLSQRENGQPFRACSIQ